MSPRHAPAVALAAALAAQGCALLVGIEVLSNRAGSGPIPCQVPTDCPVGGNVCFVRTCVGGVCGLNEAPAGTPVASQIAGDCKQVRCTADGRTEEVVAPDDVASDGDECTLDACVDGAPSHAPAPPGAPCALGVCGPFGRCVRCIEGVDETQCEPGVEVCSRDFCARLDCVDGAQNGAETDVDCGGPACPPCGEGARCGGSGDCAEGVCEDGRCVAPSCEDGAQNGDESDLDCGGPACAPCNDGAFCRSPSDCQSGVCNVKSDEGSPPTCLAPSCTDGVQNGGEIAEDCGGGCLGTCDDGEPCANDDECSSRVCDQSCQKPSCQDFVQNGTEEGVDCGGDCPPCAEGLARRAR
ncbi:MAG TPA: hypothetical protein VFS43_21595 [Polyangiaceae bacterium]|nr:hypothetical protein [Polyangiaceae bacterium]